MEGNSKPFQHHGCWEICKRWVLFQDPPQERFGHTLVFRHVSSNAVGDEQGSLTIQETRVENPSTSEASIPRAMERDTPRPRYSPNTRIGTCWPTPEGDESHLLSANAENK